MKQAGNIGTVIHGLCEQINLGVSLGELEIGSESIYRMVEAYYEWFCAAVDEVIDVEKTVVAHDYQYAGTADLVAVLKGDTEPSVIDIKTSGAIYPDMALQLAAYEYVLGTSRRLICHIDKKDIGKWRIKEYTNPDDFRMFLYAKELWNYFYGGKPVDRKSIVVVR